MNQLTEKQLATLVNLLDGRERSLESVVNEHIAQLRDVSVPDMPALGGDMADQAEIELVREHENAAVVRDLSALRDIEDARARIAADEAGACIDCGEAIGFKRLLAQPTASRCVHCQVLYEETHQPNYQPVVDATA